jgi:hypothetical protein
VQQVDQRLAALDDVSAKDQAVDALDHMRGDVESVHAERQRLRPDRLRAVVGGDVFRVAWARSAFVAAARSISRIGVVAELGS